MLSRGTWKDLADLLALRVLCRETHVGGVGVYRGTKPMILARTTEECWPDLKRQAPGNRFSVQKKRKSGFGSSAVPIEETIRQIVREKR